jgi:hypothetical protein
MLNRIARSYVSRNCVSTASAGLRLDSGWTFWEQQGIAWGTCRLIPTVGPRLSGRFVARQDT